MCSSDLKSFVANAGRNARLFLKNDFHMEAGKKNLIAAFYRSITERAPVPIPYHDILMTARVMDAIFEQVGASTSEPSRGTVVPC